MRLKLKLLKKDDIIKRCFVLLLLSMSLFVKAEESVLGNTDSPVTLIEYGSLTCDHCIGFHRKVLPKIKEAYIDTGKVKFIYRHFPTSKIALQAAVAAECSGDKYYEVLDSLYNNIREWYIAKDKYSVFKKHLIKVNADVANFKQCFENENTVKNIYAMQRAAIAKYDVQGTPTFIVNGKVIKGEHSFEELKREIDAAYSQ
ncbi:DsbA family protein [Aliikangiella marina]|uniref:DsbA family protein n=1 Tax=Aliikangiella marina TaxID=1712262 RepID=A0A545T8Z6_9GAMM|nr:DsbA family protein [Aliikangiella marina]TQV73694.1 DsbA family protein [Aliikangiella marina]